METVLQIILPSVILPLVLSVIVWWLIQRSPLIQWYLPLIWLPSYVWISGIPLFPPSEAKDWLWVFLSLSILVNLLFKSRLTILIKLQTLLLALMLVVIAWPVVRYQFNIMLLVEIIVVLINSYTTLYFIGKTSAATLTSLPSLLLSITISSAGLGLVVSLAGSLLIGQLAGALAASLGVFTVIEFAYRSRQQVIRSTSVIPIIQLYFAILVIARIYVELPLGIALFLLLAPLVGLIPKLRYSYIYSAIAVICASSWLMLTTDSSSYY